MVNLSLIVGHIRKGAPFRRGCVRGVENWGGGDEIWKCRTSTSSIRQFELECVWCAGAKGEQSVPKHAGGNAKLAMQAYISIESPLGLAKLKPAPWGAVFVPKPKVPSALVVPSSTSATSSSSEKYFSIML